MGGRSRAWTDVLRSTLLFTPFLLLTLVAVFFLALQIIDEGASAGRIVGLSLVSLIALLLAYQVVQSVRDLFSGLAETTGEVQKSWTRNDMFLFKNSYVFVDRNVYRVPPEQFLNLTPGDTVRIVHTPHTGAVETIEKVGEADTPA